MNDKKLQGLNIHASEMLAKMTGSTGVDYERVSIPDPRPSSGKKEICPTCDGLKLIIPILSGGRSGRSVPCPDCSALGLAIQRVSESCGLLPHEMSYKLSETKRLLKEANQNYEWVTHFAKYFPDPLKPLVKLGGSVKPLPNCVLISGSFGGGKTVAGKAFVARCVSLGIKAEYTHTGEYMDTWKASWKDSSVNVQSVGEQLKIPVKVYDEIDKVGDGREIDKFARILSGRYNLPYGQFTSVFITNKTPKELEEIYGQYIGDRLKDFRILKWDGESLRGSK